MENRKIHVPKHQPGVLWAIFARHLGDFEAGCLDQGRPRVRSKGLGFPQLSHVFFVILPGKTVKNYALVINKLEFSVQKKIRIQALKLPSKLPLKDCYLIIQRMEFKHQNWEFRVSDT
jgi:hypothetical protein